MPKKSAQIKGTYNLKGLAFLTQLWADLSKLNFHKFRHNFKDTVNPLCPGSDGSRIQNTYIHTYTHLYIHNIFDNKGFAYYGSIHTILDSSYIRLLPISDRP